MSFSQRLLLAFVFVMYFTPGPNNIMLMSSGLTYGFRRTLPHIAGVTIGFAFMIASVGMIVIGTITAYAAIAHFPWNIVIQTAISLAVGTASTIAWALFGSALRPVRSSARAVRAFNIVMAVLLLASLYPVFMDH